jgi:HSP20 family protein
MANITRWNPVREMITLREAVDQMMNDTLNRTRDQRQAWLLPVDAYATADALVLRADVPGLNPDDLQVTLEGDTLTIRGQFNNRAEGQTYLMQERLVGKFERVLTINTPVQADKVEATFENGVLTLTLPKAEAVKPKQITIKRG